MEIEKKIIDTAVGKYTVRWFYEVDPNEPESCGLGIARTAKDYIDIARGSHSDEVQAILRNNRNAYDYREIRSSAAVARYLRLKYDFRSVVVIDDRFRYSGEPTTDRNKYYSGLAWEDSPVSGQYDEAMAHKNVENDLAMWHAWAEGQVFCYVVTDPSGNVIDMDGHYYGELAYEDTEYAIKRDVAERVNGANLVGSGLIGLI